MGTVSRVCGVRALFSWGCCGSAVALGAGIAGRSRARERGLDTTASTFGAVLGLLAWLMRVVAFGGLAVLSSFLEQAR
jgi:hypothetical protein